MLKSISCTFRGLALITGIFLSTGVLGQTTIANQDMPASDTVITLKLSVLANNGYMTIPKSRYAGAFSIVKENRVKELAGVSIDALLQGQASGVRVVNTSGAPGSGAL